jgi:AcrR family transcriptional regulator
VRTAVLEAATRRFAAQGPNASLRDIAEDAHVNLGLIHRHFGNKDDLLREVLLAQVRAGRHAFEDESDVGKSIRHLFEGVVGNDVYVRIIAWLLLYEPHRLRYQDDFPAIRSLRELEAAAAHDEDDAGDRDLRLMAAITTSYGWTIFGPLLLAAFGYSDADREDVERRLAALLSRTVG